MSGVSLNMTTKGTAILLLVSFLSACASGKSDTGSVPARTTSVEPRSSPASRVVVQEVAGPDTAIDGANVVSYGDDIISAPVNAGARATISQPRALVAASASTQLVETPDIALRMVSFDPSGGRPIAPGANNNSSVTSTLAWLIIYRNTPADVRGPAGTSKDDARKIANNEQCQNIVVVDALSGAGIVSEQQCSPVATSAS
jgi:hypothetical protein